jgi:ATP-dependent exoDNAse (exonuclease V) alpha subunit
MAIYYLNVKTIGRSAGGKSTSAAAYRAGERIRDERTGQIFDHAHRTDVMHKQIVVPSKLAALDMSWVHDRSALWNAAELAERRGNARVAREYLVALPHELTPAQRLGLVQRFSQELADQHGFAVDFAIHAPRHHNDPRSYHAHLLTTTRELLPTGLGAKTALDLRDSERRARGLGSWLNELLTVRARWATITNEALLMANVHARIDHRSLDAQGIDREPVPHIPVGARHTEARGKRSEIAEKIRAAYRVRVQARLARTADRAPAAHSARNLEEIRREAQQSWLRLRQTKLEKLPAQPSGLAQDQARTDALKESDVRHKGRDDDLAM